MSQPVRLGLVFSRSGQQLSVNVPPSVAETLLKHREVELRSEETTLPLFINKHRSEEISLHAS